MRLNCQSVSKVLQFAADVCCQTDVIYKVWTAKGPPSDNGHEVVLQ